MEMKRNSTEHLERLWSQRTTSFIQELRPYLGYALQSASIAIILLMLVSTYGYRRFLSDVPPGFPLLLTAALAVWPVIALTPVRTFLKEADLIYLLPLESEMTVYLKRAERRSLVLQGLILLAVWMIAWPLYKLEAGGGIAEFARVLAVLLLGKKILLRGRFTELQQSSRISRGLLALLRWAAAFGLAWTQMSLPLWSGLLTAALGMLAYLGIMKLLDRRTLLWVHLISVENRQRANLFRILNLFVDVPHIQGRARNVHAPAGLLRLLGGQAFRSADAYRYLYIRVWLRSEWFGMICRLVLVGIVILAFLRGSWLPGAVFLLFSFLVMIQLKELQKAYRHSDWSQVYPLPAGLREHSAASVRFRLHMTATAFLFIPALLQMTEKWWAALLFAGVWGISSFVHRNKK